MVIDVAFWLDFIVRFGLPFSMLAFFVLACFKKWIVFSWVYEAQVEATLLERDRASKWETRAIALLEAAAKGAQAAERAVVRATESDRSSRGG